MRKREADYGGQGAPGWRVTHFEGCAALGVGRGGGGVSQPFSHINMHFGWPTRGNSRHADCNYVI